MERAAAKTFQDLMVWQKAHQFVLATYLYSDYFPQKEVYSLTSQLRRAAGSIPVSIAESFKLENACEQARLLGAAESALEECRYYLILAKDLGYGDNQQLLPQLEELSRLLLKERASLRDSDS